MYDIAVVGAGPAGYSAAVTARKRNCSVILIGQNTGWLSKTESITNYPGFEDIPGPELLDRMRRQAADMGAELVDGVVHQVLPMGKGYAVSVKSDFYQAKKVILCTGAKQPKLLPGEAELLGRGVSYCGTCDGMFYRGKRVAVIAGSGEAVAEANFLAGICSGVDWFGKPEDGLDQRIVCRSEVPTAVYGSLKAEGLKAGETELPFDGVFIFRDAMALDSLLPGLQREGAFIAVDRRMATNLHGVFAAGDCTGLPLQAVKAAGEGCTAAFCAAMELAAESARAK